MLFSTETDTCDCREWSVIPTFEATSWTYLGGMETSGVASTQDIDGLTVVNLQPGVRVAVSERIDFGVTASWNITSDRVYRYRMGADFRVMW